MKKTIGDGILFIGTLLLLTNAVQFLTRTRVTAVLLPIALVLFVVGAGLIRRGRSERSG